MTDVPDQARVVVVGGGIVGCSVAYHLASRGVSDVLLLEREELTSGTTWHAAGLVGQLRSSQNLTRLAKYTAELLPALELETGQATGFQQRGSVSVATTPERLDELLRNVSAARLFGLEAQVLSAAEVAQLVPVARVDDVVGGVFLPGDGSTNPVDTTRAFAQGARARGATILEHAAVTAVVANDGQVHAVRCRIAGEEREIRCSIVVNAAGMWSRQLVEPLGVDVPLHAAEHFYVVTEVIPELAPGMPVLRDPDGCSYFKEDAGKLLVGWFEPVAKPWAVQKARGESSIPDDFAFGTLPPDLDHIAPLLERAVHRVPLMEDAGIQLFFNGPESFTPDDRYLLGPAPAVQGLFLACGFNSIGIQSAGGAGRVLADWIIDGHPPMDLWDVDVRRMMPFQNTSDYLRDRTEESLGLLYAMHWPSRQFESARGARRTPFHAQLAAEGACFGEVAGWERANWYSEPGGSPRYEYSYGRENWFPNARAEHTAVRDHAGLIDLSSFGKFVVKGPDAARSLNQICANDVDVAPGRVVYTQWLNERGTIEADVTVTRESDDQFLVVTAAATQVRDLVWLDEHIGPEARCSAFDVTSAYAVLGIMGPESRSLLSSLSIDDFSNAGFPFGSSRVVDLGYARVRASRISYAGELGWELYIPAEFASYVLEHVRGGVGSASTPFVGYHALNSLRMEKAYRHWGHDIGTDDTPLEAGLGFAVAWDKPGGFIGRDRLLSLRDAGVSRHLVQLRLSNDDVLLHHNEPILRDGQYVGRVTSGAYGHTVGRSLALGYVSLEAGESTAGIEVGEGFVVDVGTDQVPATASLRPAYDPGGSRLRS